MPINIEYSLGFVGFGDYEGVGQFDDASASGAEGCAFDPRRAHQPSLAAQSESCHAGVMLSMRRRTMNQHCETTAWHAF